MADSPSKPEEGSFWHQCNIRLNAIDHGGRTVGYRITHLSTGRVYVGWMGDAYRGLRLVASRLVSYNFPNQTLQVLMDIDPRYALEVFIPDRHLPENDQLELLREVMEGWILAAGANNIYNSAALPARKPPMGEKRPRRARLGKPPAPAKPTKERKVRTGPRPDSQTPWRNVYVNSLEHTDAGVFKLQHASGMTFVGSSFNLYEGLAQLSHKLRKQTLRSQAMLDCFKADPTFEITLQMIDRAIPFKERGLKAVELADQWLRELGSQGEMVLKARGTFAAAAAVNGGRKLPSIGAMHQCTVGNWSAQDRPPVDFLHQAWFGSGL